MNRQFWKGFFVGVIFSIGLAYSFFRIYWIMEVGIKYFRWHAVIWFYLVLLIAIGAGSFLLYKKRKLQTATAQKQYLMIIGSVAGFFFAEFFLRATSIGKTYSEKRFGIFIDPMESVQKKWYMTWRPYEAVFVRGGDEFILSRTTNSEGLSDKEWNTSKDSSEIRVLTLGDSFTEGDGAPQDSSYPRLMEKILLQQFPDQNITVMQGGHIGSDPWFEYKKLSDRLLKYKPDIVVYTNGSNDLLYDHLYYGGMERFSYDSTVKTKLTKHWWMPLYEVSYVFRAAMNVLGYDYTLIGYLQREKNKITAIQDSKQLSQAYSKLAVENNFECIQVIRADKINIENEGFDFDYSGLIDGTDSLPHYSNFNLLQFYLDSLGMNRQNLHQYFWHTDAHHNCQGYEAMAKGISVAVTPLIQAKSSFRTK